MQDKISSWVRQSRHRAKKHGVVNRLATDAVRNMVEELNSKCAYCDGDSSSLDHPFQLNSSAPNVLANVLPCCAACKAKKGNSDLIQFLNSGGISNDDFIALIGTMFLRDGGDELRKHVKNITGIGL